LTTDLSRALTAAMQDEEFVRSMHECARAFQRYAAKLPFIPFSYSRTQLIKTTRFEIVAMQWAPGSVSPIHDHGTSRCWVLMLAGTLDVENFLRDDDGWRNPAVFHPTHSARLRADDIDHRYGPLELHRVRNTAPQAAVSLQLYAAPLTVYSIVDASSGLTRRATAACDLVLDLFS
jgi:predicted metal-dependent enzyme (double-stranded beta helix superfamily)